MQKGDRLLAKKISALEAFWVHYFSSFWDVCILGVIGSSLFMLDVSSGFLPSEGHLIPLEFDFSF